MTWVLPNYERFLAIVKSVLEWGYRQIYASNNRFGHVYGNLFLSPNIAKLGIGETLMYVNVCQYINITVNKYSQRK